MTDPDLNEIRQRALTLHATPATTLMGQALVQVTEDCLKLLSHIACLIEDVQEMQAMLMERDGQLRHERKMRDYAEADAEQLRRGIYEYVGHFPPKPGH